MKKIIDDLNILLAENYALYLKTQCYHWNVIGANFYPLHLLFEKQYIDLAEANDTIAERIRALGAPVHASFSIFNSAKAALDPKTTLNARVMLEDLVTDHHHLKELALKLSEAAAAAKDKATEDLMIERIGQHEKQVWLLKSSE